MANANAIDKALSRVSDDVKKSTRVRGRLADMGQYS